MTVLSHRYFSLFIAAFVLMAGAGASYAQNEGDDASALRGIDILNGTNQVAFVRSAGQKEIQVLPGDNQLIQGIIDSTVVIETRAQPSSIPSTIQVQPTPKDPYAKAASTTGQIVVENAWNERLEIYLDGKWVSTLGAGSTFAQNLQPGRYAMTITDPLTKAALVERELQVRLDKTLKWVMGAEDDGKGGYLSVRNLSQLPIFLFVNERDRGTLGAGAERTFFGVQPINKGDVAATNEAKAVAALPVEASAPAAAEVAPKSALQTGSIWGAEAESQTIGDAPPPSQNRQIQPVKPGSERDTLQGMDAATLQRGSEQSAAKAKVGTLKIGNQTDRVMSFYVNGQHVGDLEPKQEVELGEQALGEYMITAEDRSMGAFVRGRVSIIKPGQIVVWNAKGWF